MDVIKRTPPRSGKKFLYILLTFVISLVVSSIIAALISLLFVPLAPGVSSLLEKLALPPSTLWQQRFWQLVTFLAGTLVSIIVGLLFRPLTRRQA